MVYSRNGHRRHRWVTAVVGVAALSLLTAQAAAAYTSATQTEHTSKAAPEAAELSGLVSSPMYPDWYWSMSDVWKTTDAPVACSGLAGGPLRECQQVQRSRIWAIHLDPVTHEAIEIRSFAVSNPAWALDPVIAQDNDWEDITVGPPRATGDGGTTRNLIIAATGDAKVNRVYDASGTDITCDTRRLIEFTEPDLNDPTVRTWSPWKIFDIKNFVGLGRITSCNAESLVQAPNANGAPQAYFVTRGGGRVLTRSLAVDSGRDPQTPRTPVGSGASYAPAVDYVGKVKGSKGAQLTAADTDGDTVVMTSPQTSTKPCQLFQWSTRGSTFAATVTSIDPVKDAIACKSTEGVAFTRNRQDPGSFGRDLVTISDTRTGVVRHWYLPAG